MTAIFHSNYTIIYYYLIMAVAIIAEYNPFHNGHIYQLKEAKRR